jgi:hypothetical protein
MIVVANNRSKSKTNRKVEDAIRKARKIAKSHSDPGFNELERRETKRNNARIRRYAMRNGLKLQHHSTFWLIRPDPGAKFQVVMPAGYFAIVDGILHQLVAE